MFRRIGLSGDVPFFLLPYQYEEWTTFVLRQNAHKQSRTNTMIKRLLYLVLACILLNSCSNDFEVAAAWKEVPVVYAILSPKDTAHYVRVEKAFLDPSRNALEIAQIADSLYYPEDAITVWLEQVGTNNKYQLHRVDGNLEGYVRQPGVFATSPNWLYKVKDAALLPGATYRVVVQRKDGKPDITAQTTLPADFLITTPDPTNIVRKVTFGYSSTTSLVWRTDENGVYFNATFILPYREEAPDGTVLLRDTLVWQPVNNVERTDQQLGQNLYKGNSEVSGAALFKFLANNLQNTDNFRYFERGALILEGGGKEIKEFNITASANSGLTGAEVYPVYTNLSEVYGIVTGKNSVRMDKIQISESTVDSLKLNPLTQGLKFRI